MQNVMSSSPSTPRLDRVNLEKEYLNHMVLKVPFGRIFRWLKEFLKQSSPQHQLGNLFKIQNRLRYSVKLLRLVYPQHPRLAPKQQQLLRRGRKLGRVCVYES